MNKLFPIQRILSIVVSVGIALTLAGCAGLSGSQADNQQQGNISQNVATLDVLPSYDGKPYVEINDGRAAFTEDELTSKTFEYYAPLDTLGRATLAFALVSDDTRPANGEKRKSISEIHPSGWVQAQYNFIKGKSLYNRSHLIAWSLGNENANESNLITGTTYMNQDTMQKFEEPILSYIRNTGRHVLVRVTPMYEGSELVAHGVHYEARDIEDDGNVINFDVYMFNVQPGVVIEYDTGKSWAE